MGYMHNMYPHEEITLFHARDILTCARINTDFIAWIDKQGNVDDGARFECGRFSDIVHGVTTHAGFGALHDQFQKVWQFDGDNGIGFAIHQQFYNILLFEIAHSISQHRFRQGLLIECFGIHEDVVVAINIKELPVLMFNAHGIYLFARAESLLNNAARSQILQVYAHERAPVSWTDMMKLSHCIQVVVIAYNHAVIKICCSCSAQWSGRLSFLQNNISMVNCQKQGNRTSSTKVALECL